MARHMRVASLSDVHGNLPALEAVLADVDAAEVDLVVFGGDHAAGPLPRETLERIRALGDRARLIRGNADRELVQARAGERREDAPPVIDWVAAQLTSEQVEFLAALPEQLVLEIDGLGAVRFCHGSPRTDMEILTAQTPDGRLREAVANVAEDVVVCGHTHMQFDRSANGTRVMNPGSVGLPYEGTPGAYWAVLGPDVTFIRSEYDVEEAATRIRQSGYPDVDEFVDEFILSSHAREETMEFFENLAREDPRFAGAPD
jgi:putative phosphoesterase